MDLGLEGKVAIVAGASADAGRAAALLLGREGARLILSGRRGDALEEVASAIKDAGGWALAVPADLTEPGAADALVQQAVDACGRVDLLANTVGPFPLKAYGAGGPGPIYGDDDGWAEAFNGIFMSATRLTRAVMPHMKAQGAGAIVHLGSNSARYYSPMTGQFGAMKAALVHVIKNWARDAAPHGVRVNAVLPGWIKGENIAKRVAQSARESGTSEAEAEREMARGHDNLYWTPRMGRPEEYASAMAFLLSERASYINGALLPVDGGSPVW